jgi:uncharacterized protein YutE (UPF0331/DUF86 family)
LASRRLERRPRANARDCIETCRHQRNVIDYDYAEVATESEATFLREKLTEYQKLVESWIAKNYPKLKQ